MKLSSLAVFFLVVALGGNAHAYKECTIPEVTFVFSDASHTYLGTNRNAQGGPTLNGRINSTRSDYNTMISIALAAKVSGSAIRIRYQDDTVNCTNAPWNAEITGIGI